MGDVELEIFVGYENVTVDFGAVSVNGNGGNRTSAFDRTQSSIRLAGNHGSKYLESNWKNGLKFTLLAKSGDFIDDNVKITGVSFGNDETDKNNHLANPINGNEVTLYHMTDAQEPNNGPSGTLYRSEYVGVLTIKYTYNTYTKENVPGEKNFLVYHDMYYR
jgi:hypothetical protein